MTDTLITAKHTSAHKALQRDMIAASTGKGKEQRQRKRLAKMVRNPSIADL
jgi:hypothetical protein